MDSDDLFGSPSNDDDLFGGPSNALDAGSDVDLFGGKDDAMFGEPSQPVEDDDLFATPNDDADLFTGNAAPAGGDDFLSGDAGFSFLDDKPAAAPASEEWGDDLFAERSEPIEEEPSAGDSF